jgi:hypothetical protein
VCESLTVDVAVAKQAGYRHHVLDRATRSVGQGSSSSRHNRRATMAWIGENTHPRLTAAATARSSARDVHWV